jgi:two-component system sensor histidine kinase PilS (NtrC family)
MIGLRLIVISSVVLPYFLFQISTAEVPLKIDFLYVLAGLTYLATIIYIVTLKLLRHALVVQAYIQFIGDLLLISGLVYHFGGVGSPFSILYFIVVMVASTLVSRQGGLWVGVIAWLCYAVIVTGLYLQWIPPAVGALSDAVSRFRLLYSLVTHLFGFYAVAHLTSRLVQSVSRAEQELISERQDLADLRIIHDDVIQSMPSGLITTDLTGNITSANLAALQILGRPGQQLLGTKVQEIGFYFPPVSVNLLERPESPEKTRHQMVYVLDGKEKYIGFSANPLATASGTPAGQVFIFQDLSDWKKLQDEIRLKDRMAAVGELAAGIAHEIGNPLAAISGSAQMLAAKYQSDSSMSHLLEIILKESQRLDRTIKGFLKFARPKERSNEPFDIAQQLIENISLLKNSPEVLATHHLELDVNPKTATVIADPDQVSQIFWNLSRNALRAMPDGGTLKVEGTLEKQQYQLQFSDTGRGMTQSEKERIFHPFQSFFDTGTGIGMAIVYRIVQQHGGRLDVQSSLGQGTVVSINLPVTPNIAEPTRAKALT